MSRYKLDNKLDLPVLGVLCLECGWVGIPFDFQNETCCACPNECLIGRNDGDAVDFSARNPDMVQLIVVEPIPTRAIVKKPKSKRTH